jgi:hypothetical protein
MFKELFSLFELNLHGPPFVSISAPPSPPCLAVYKDDPVITKAVCSVDKMLIETSCTVLREQCSESISTWTNIVITSSHCFSCSEVLANNISK